MIIKFIEIQNFRKLQSVRIDFSEKTTLFVGANNSGKTSAMVALGHFLVDAGRFTTNDFTLSNWLGLERIGEELEKQAPTEDLLSTSNIDWNSSLPCLDIWLEVGANEIHRIRHLVPTLDWTGGILGVRLRYEPKNVKDLQKEYFAAAAAARSAIKSSTNEGENKKEYTLSLWPKNFKEFLDRKLRSTFEVKAYLLNPAKCELPANGMAKPQALPAGSEPLDTDPFQGLIRIDEIAAQRGLGDHGNRGSSEDGKDSSSSKDKRRLSDQLRTYYSKHLDPFEFPVQADLDALQAIEDAQKAFDDRLSSSFSEALAELGSLNYPGVTDPKMKIATKLRPTDGLNHSAAVQYEVAASDGDKTSLRLPEEFNGLGYQNLISMVFKLMSFRDAWMRVGKADRQADKEEVVVPPLHLVLVEEPEAHLHVQVQQVFVRKAYEVLRNHKDLMKNHDLETQLVVSTHSSHVAHEMPFSCLRYFRRLPANGEGKVPTSAVVNLSEVFGTNDETERFVTRYLKSTHCDLFFADAAILVEGPVERMLVPHFIRKHFDKLNKCYVTLLEIGGSHAHRLKNLIEHLGLTTLIVTDLDSVSSDGRHPATPPKRGVGLLTGNSTLKIWHPKKSLLDDLFDIPKDEKVIQSSGIPHYAIRIAYQTPLSVKIGGSANTVEALATTFEDALVFENLALFAQLDGTGMIKKFKESIETHKNISDLGADFFQIVREGEKAEFALDLLWLDKKPTLLDDIVAPGYIHEGLSWLQCQLIKDQKLELPVPTLSEVAGG
jgi:predicted ATP-dependent endonuclease of OLD family